MESLDTNSSSCSSYQLYVSLSKSLYRDVLVHYLQCPRAQGREISYNDGFKPGANFIAADDMRSETDEWVERKRCLEKLIEMHNEKEEKYTSSVVYAVRHEFTTQQLLSDLRNMINRHWNETLALLIIKLSQQWNIQELKFEESE